MNNRELLPCPCCDSAELDYAANESSPKLSDYIMCNGQDGCGLMISREDTPNGDLLAAWNKRPTRPAQTEQQPLIYINPLVVDELEGIRKASPGGLTWSRKACAHWTYPLYATPIAQTAQPEQSGLAVPSLTEQEMDDLREFHQAVCCDAGHRVEKEGMRRLAEIGVVESVGFGKHRLTEFGTYWLAALSLQGGE